MELPPNKNKRENAQWVISYLTLRRSVGILGIALPILLFLGFLILDPQCEFPPSISHYYFTNLGTYFTGTLCAVSLFLFSYNGPEDKDKYAALVAAVAALGVAFVPVSPYCTHCSSCLWVHLAPSAIRNGIHYGFATVLFLTFAYFSLVLFTKTDLERSPTKQKLVRNKIYRLCGWIIIGCILIIGFSGIPVIATAILAGHFRMLTFVFEAIALLAFGYSWLIKGDTFFKDVK